MGRVLVSNNCVTKTQQLLHTFDNMQLDPIVIKLTLHIW